MQPFLADSQSSSDMDTNEATFSNTGPFNNDFNLVESVSKFCNNYVFFILFILNLFIHKEIHAI